MSRLSIIVPALDEAAGIRECLAALQPMRERGTEVLVVDGGSADATARLAAPQADRVITAPRGRAAQMNAGAAIAAGDTLLFLHADTRLPEGADGLVLAGLAASGRAWGRFDVAIEGGSRLLAVVAAFMGARSRLTAIATGDQAIFVRREAFRRAGGFPSIALMEDIAFSRAMKRQGPPLCLRERAVTSARRWERHGTVRTILLMWWLRLAYFLGADPARLAQRYGHGRAAR
ncbi:MAG TPA: TIGR04283 family arsenosugar biosynthesis glycosyltransferase [Usitatibacteraceae bacterium]|nr:TIGR04283 family arsenosugar biosynthesis glycosyltransferase [Usitatibacteraceae bacterium]